MHPVKIQGANLKLIGDPKAGVADLHVLQREYPSGISTVMSEWRMSLSERILVLFTGSVFVSVATRDYPPIKVSVENKA